MSKFNTATARPTVKSPVQTERHATGVTHEGAPGFARDAKSELFLLAVANMVGEGTFYEKAGRRDERFERLVAEIAPVDPGWTAGLLGWLRAEANMRSASLVGGLEAARAMVAAKVPGARRIVNSVLQRADEPGEALAYWTSRYGRAIPKPVKRGVADAARRLYTERSLLKYDTASHGFRFADVLELCHPAPSRSLTASKTIADLAEERGVPVETVEEALRRVAASIRENLDPDEYMHLSTADFVRRPLPALSVGWRSRVAARALGMTTESLIAELRPPADGSEPWRSALFKYAVDRRHGRDDIRIVDTGENPALPVVYANLVLRSRAAEDPSVLLDPDALRGAGMTWEDALSLAGSKVDKAALWTALIPSMSLMALARNLRNLDQAGVDDDTAARVCARFADPEQVARSRMFPFRWLAAYRNAPSLRWGHALDKALTASLAHVPKLRGRSLILVDLSGSMGDRAGGSNSDMTRADVAKVFGSALALRTDPTLVWFDGSSGRVDVPAGGSLLRLVESFPRRGGWTSTAAAVARWYAGHDRVVIVTDEQANYSGQANVTASVPTHVPVYTWNLAGYRHGHAPSGVGTRHTFGGLSDAAFKLIPLLERGKDAPWPWEVPVVPGS